MFGKHFLRHVIGVCEIVFPAFLQSPWFVSSSLAFHSLWINCNFDTHASWLHKTVCVISPDYLLGTWHSSSDLKSNDSLFTAASLYVLEIIFRFPAPNSTIVGGMPGIGLNACGGRSDRPVYVLVSLPQKNRVCEASNCSVVSEVTSTLTSVHRTDSAIMSLVSYSISSGLLTRWDLTLRDLIK